MAAGSLRSEAIDHVGIAHQHQIKPAAASATTCGHANLPASRLQQGPNVLQTTRIQCVLTDTEPPQSRTHASIHTTRPLTLSCSVGKAPTPTLVV